MLVGITRVRNEAPIIADTIEHFLGYCDHILLYDDCSTDATASTAKRAGRERIEVIQGTEWLTDRPAEETRHRGLLLYHARAMGADWCLCFDADERLVGALPPLQGDGYRFRLFDGYLVTEQSLRQPYTSGSLAELPRMWGPEFRDILMLFRTAKARYEGLDRREPVLHGQIALAEVKVKHFGKCLSVEHWEETCEYYATYFPEPYRSKWEKRRGRAIHLRSDFGRPLQTWAQLLDNPESWVRC